MQKLKYALSAGAASIAMALGVAMPAAATQVAICESGRQSDNECTNITIDRSQDRTTTLGNCSAIIRSRVDQRQETTAVTNQNNSGAGVGTGAGGNGDADARGSGRNGGDSTADATGGDGTGVGANEQTNTSTNTATGTQVGGVFFAPDCSTHNVTNNPVREVVHTREVVTTVTASANQSGGGRGRGGAVTAATTSGGESFAAVTQVQAPVGGVGAGAGGGAGSAAASLFGLGGSLFSMGLGAIRLFKREQ